MAYAITNQSVLAITIRGTLFAQEVMNTFHYQYLGPTILDGAAALPTANTIFTQAGGPLETWAAVVSSDVIEVETSLQWIYPDRYRRRVFSGVINQGSAGRTGTPNLAMVVTFQSDIADARSNAPKHLPGVPSDFFDDGLLDGGVVTNLGVFASAYLTDIPLGAGILEPCIYGRPKNAFTKCGVEHPAQPVSRRQATGYVVNNKVRTMRRRTLGLGS